MMILGAAPLEIMLSLTIGMVAACGLYLMLRRSLLKMVVGFGVFSQAVNLFVFSSGGLVPVRAPVIAASAESLAAGTADPLPQALVLTAIVIGFAAQIFLLVLVQRTWKVLGTGDSAIWARSEK